MDVTETYCGSVAFALKERRILLHGLHETDVAIAECMRALNACRGADTKRVHALQGELDGLQSMRKREQLMLKRNDECLLSLISDSTTLMMRMNDANNKILRSLLASPRA